MTKCAGFPGLEVSTECAGTGDVRIRWLLTAGFDLTTSGTRLLIDPYLSRNDRAVPKLSLRVEDFTDVRWIFVTHGHFDHALDVPALVRAGEAIVVASRSVCENLVKRGVPRGRLHPLRAGEFLRAEYFTVKAIRSRHVRFDLQLMGNTLGRVFSSGRASEILPLLRLPPGEVLGYLFDFKGFTVAHFGSPGYYENEIRSLTPDLLLLPIQGHTRIHRIAAAMASLTAAKAVFPMHCDDFCPPFSQAIPLEPLLREMARVAPSIRICLQDR
jgi:L-ascorbate metabolism protein UlaG (beta-lactamase superfamily)